MNVKLLMVGVMMSVLTSMDCSNVCVILPDMKLELTIRPVWVRTALVKLFIFLIHFPLRYYDTGYFLVT